MAGIKAILLDVDGTLIDSNDAHANAWVDVGRESGHPIAFDDVRRLIGMGGDRVLPQLTGVEEDSAEGKRISKRRGEIFLSSYLPSLQPFADARALLQRMSHDGYTLVTASSASEKDLAALLEQAGLEDLIDGTTSSDDAESSKPSPDILEAALERAGCSAEEAVMIGDTPYDVQAAVRAGVRCIAFRCGGWGEDALADAIEVYDDPSHLLRAYDESVLGTSLR